MSKIKDLPLNERPREKALTYGVETLSNSELLSILIGNGTKQKSAIDIASEILSTIEDISCFNLITYSSLTEIKGISKAKAILLLSLVELNKRINTSLRVNKEFNFNEIIHHFQCLYKDLKVEKAYIVLLDNHKRLISIKEVASGSEKSLALSQKKIIQYLIDFSATSYYLVHNHPSGSCVPSCSDKTTTSNVELVSMSLGFILEDHLIFGKNTYYSLKNNLELPYYR